VAEQKAFEPRGKKERKNLTFLPSREKRKGRRWYSPFFELEEEEEKDPRLAFC